MLLVSGIAVNIPKYLPLLVSKIQIGSVQLGALLDTMSTETGERNVNAAVQVHLTLRYCALLSRYLSTHNWWISGGVQGRVCAHALPEAMLHMHCLMR